MNQLTPKSLQRLAAASVLIATLGGCVVNPVTGEREVALVTPAQEIAIGQQQYVPAQQMQGGAYRTDAELDAYVSRVGKRLAQSSGVDLPYEFTVLNSSVPNAWALPGGKIAINRGLLTELRNEAELAAVLGHEIAHAAARHGAKRIERGYLTQGAVVIAAIGAGGSGYGGQVVGAAQQAAQLINQTYSRNAEREADFYGTQFMAKAGYDPHAAVTLQETFVRLSGAGEQDWLQGLFASHPASAERVTNNRSLVKQLRAEGFNGGELNQPAFAAAMGRLREAQPAYEAYDEAVKAYGEDDLKTAQNRVDTAILRYNAEAKFHALRGAIRGKQRRWADAVTNFDRAVERDDQYFAHYLARGLARVELGEEGLAKTDLERSVKLLPTADAYQALGKIAESNGDMAAAKAYYEQAAGGGGP